MLAIISSVEADPRAPIVLRLSSSSQIRGGSRRVTRTPTLDGGAVLVDHGYCDADRTFALRASRLSRGEVEALEVLASGLAAITVAVEDGVYAGKADRIKTDGGEVEISFLVQRRL